MGISLPPNNTRNTSRNLTHESSLSSVDEYVDIETINQSSTSQQQRDEVTEDFDATDDIDDIEVGFSSSPRSQYNIAVTSRQTPVSPAVAQQISKTKPSRLPRSCGAKRHHENDTKNTSVPYRAVQYLQSFLVLPKRQKEPEQHEENSIQETRNKTPTNSKNNSKENLKRTPKKKPNKSKNQKRNEKLVGEAAKPKQPYYNSRRSLKSSNTVMKNLLSTFLQDILCIIFVILIMFTANNVIFLSFMNGKRISLSF